MRVALLAVAGCSGPAVSHPQPANASLSLAADEQMIVIPAGQYVAGSTPEERAAAYEDYQLTAGHDTAKENHWFDREEDRHTSNLPAFKIDLMPVTQAQYAEFVAAGKAPAPSITEAAWQAQGFSQDYATQVTRFLWKDGRPPVGREDHPVVLVTWDEANRYCKWRGEQRGEPRRLPTAAEFEKAARGDGGIAYPWGNTYDAAKLNSAVKGPNDTVSVGSFTEGASQYGVLGMAGNVFQWTSTPFSDGQMTVKGSAWEDFGGLGRGAGGHGRTKTVRHVIVGFRCAADAPT
jgi:formylglycine-generating enzyme required for sulfatase activity